MTQHRKSEPIETSELCKYGFGHIAKFKSPAGKLMCVATHNAFPPNREKKKKRIAYLMF